MYLFLRRKPRLGWRSVHTYILGTTVCMYAVALTHVVISIKLSWTMLSKNMSTRVVGTDSVCLTQVYLPTINIILSDAIVTWRAYLLWNKDKRVAIVPILLMCGTAAAGISGVVNAYTHESTVVLDAHNAWTLVINCLTLATNIAVTVLIAYRARWYKFVNRNVIQNSERRRIRWVMVLLIESGFFYCLTWGVFFVVYWTARSGNYALTDMLAQLTGIYSTLIISLVAVKMTYNDVEQTWQSTGMTAYSADSNNVPVLPIEVRVFNHTVDDRDLPVRATTFKRDDATFGYLSSAYS
ncbi:hypothetical protein OF83DRAFT_1103528 [Amylostereum chailletii]|nr:hypothetical protein OF83DRAFT_1103528 [Amylostereum chailletii]